MELSGIRDRDLVLKQIDNLKDDEFSEELFKVGYESLTKAVGGVFNDVGYGHKDYSLMNDLKRDAYKFAAFKAAHFSHNLKAANAEEKDKLMRSFETQLATEINTATKASRSAKRWQGFERLAYLYPNLEYMASSSTNKRDEHRKLYGIILPIDHSFWNRGTPPNDHGCNCDVRQTDKAATSDADIPEFELPKGIVGNPGIERKIFADNHNFYANLNKEEKIGVMNHFAELAKNIPYPKKPWHKSKAEVYVHDLHDNDKRGIAENLENAKIMAKTGVGVNIRPHMIKDDFKNPEYVVNGITSDLKTNKGANVSSLIRSARKQRCEVIVFKMHPEKSPYNYARELASKVNGILMDHYSGKFKGFWIIDKKKQVTYWEARKKVAK